MIGRFLAFIVLASAATLVAQTKPFGEDTWHRVVYENPMEFLGQSPKFQLPDREGAVAV